MVCSVQYDSVWSSSYSGVAEHGGCLFYQKICSAAYCHVHLKSTSTRICSVCERCSSTARVPGLNLPDARVHGVNIRSSSVKTLQPSCQVMQYVITTIVCGLGTFSLTVCRVHCPICGQIVAAFAWLLIEGYTYIHWHFKVVATLFGLLLCPGADMSGEIYSTLC